MAELFDGPHATPIKTDTGPVFLGISSLNNGRLDLSSMEHLSEADFPRWTKRVLPSEGDVLFSYETRIGQVALMPSDLRCCLGRRMALLRTFPNKIDSKYFVYYYLSPEFQELLRSRTIHGCTVDRISLNEFPDYEIPLPPLPIQKSIAHVLGTLDDRIELCRRTNETLESMARALFKDWFIDFGPVRAKMEGRDPYLSADVWSLFPDRLVDSELGEIPESWEYVPVSEIIEFNPTESLKKGAVAPYIDMAALPTVGCNTERPTPREFGSGMKFRNNDTLMARITPCLENGKTAYVQSLPNDVIGWGSTEFIVMRPKSPVPSEYAYILARDSNFRKHAIQSMTGTSGRQRAQATMIANYSVANATPKIWDAFTNAIRPWFTSIRTSDESIGALVSLRDALLPKLLSGELSVPDLHLLMENVP